MKTVSPSPKGKQRLPECSCVRRNLLGVHESAINSVRQDVKDKEDLPEP